MKKDYILLVTVVLMVNNVLCSTAKDQETSRRLRLRRDEPHRTFLDIQREKQLDVEELYAQVALQRSQDLHTAAEQERKLANFVTKIAESTERDEEQARIIAEALEILGKIFNVAFK